MLNQIKKDIKKVLNLKLSPFEFFYITYYITEYLICVYEEKSLTIEWIPEEQIKLLIKKHYNSFLNQFDSSEKFNYEFPKQSNGFFLYNITGKITQIKDSFGIDLLT